MISQGLLLYILQLQDQEKMMNSTCVELLSLAPIFSVIFLSRALLSSLFHWHSLTMCSRDSTLSSPMFPHLEHPRSLSYSYVYSLFFPSPGSCSETSPHFSHMWHSPGSWYNHNYNRYITVKPLMSRNEICHMKELSYLGHRVACAPQLHQSKSGVLS